jgi:hypothetical protein
VRHRKQEQEVLASQDAHKPNMDKVRRGLDVPQYRGAREKLSDLAVGFSGCVSNNVESPKEDDQHDGAGESRPARSKSGDGR